MTAKPICVVKVDMDADFGGGAKINLHMMQDAIENRLTDYYVFVVPMFKPELYSLEPIQFEVFYEKDFTEIQYEELKKIITDSIENQKQNSIV